MTYSGLERHLASEKHVMRDDNESLDDIVKRKWVSTFSRNSEPQVAQKSSLEAASETSCCQTSISRLSEGWALKKARKNTRFSAKIKAYLVEKFQIGESTKQKIDPTQLATEMRRALDEQGNRLFKPEECLKVQQIRSFFSRTAAAKKKKVPFTSEQLDHQNLNELQNEDETAEEEERLQSLKSQVLSSLCHDHPLIFDRYNICELIKDKEKFKQKFSIAMLLRICEHFEINLDGIIKGRKESYIRLLTEFAAGCKCAMEP